jgi:pimeloyl-ACP methyl ester carboxylesterase
MWGAEERVVVDGLKLRVVRAGSGPPLLLINGIGAAAEMWEPLVERLDGHELIAFDLPGSGSSRPSRRPLRIRGMAGLVARLLDALGYERVDVLGYSFGGIIAQELARRSPEHVDRLVLCATTPGIGAAPPRPLPALLMLTPARRSRLGTPPSIWRYLSQLYAVAGWSSVPWLRRVRQRTLILHGDEDPLAPPVNARTMAELIPGAQLEMIAGAGHLFLLDDPGDAVQRLAGFLSDPRGQPG